MKKNEFGIVDGWEKGQKFESFDESKCEIGKVVYEPVLARTCLRMFKRVVRETKRILQKEDLTDQGQGRSEQRLQIQNQNQNLINENDASQQNINISVIEEGNILSNEHSVEIDTQRSVQDIQQNNFLKPQEKLEQSLKSFEMYKSIEFKENFGQSHNQRNSETKETKILAKPELTTENLQNKMQCKDIFSKKKKFNKRFLGLEEDKALLKAKTKTGQIQSIVRPLFMIISLF